MPKTAKCPNCGTPRKGKLKYDTAYKCETCNQTHFSVHWLTRGNLRRK